MAFEDLLGRYCTLRVERLTPYGAALARLDADGDDADADPVFFDGRAPTILLPRREVPPDLGQGDSVEVFIYLDSEDRYTATLTHPAVALGQVAFITVNDVTDFGAFCDWGLMKDLLVPHAEQTRDLHVGDWHPIGLIIDPSGRLAGTMRVAEMLGDPKGYEVGDWVSGEAWRIEPELGLFVIVDRSYVAVLPENEPHSLERGERARFRVAALLPDGKIRLSLRGLAHTHLADDAETVFAVLGGSHAPRLGDKSSPAAIHAAFGLSKKAFKRAVGGLLKAGRIELAPDGTVRVKAQQADEPDPASDA